MGVCQAYLTNMDIAFGQGVVELAEKELSFKGSWLRLYDSIKGDRGNDDSTIGLI